MKVPDRPTHFLLGQFIKRPPKNTVEGNSNNDDADDDDDTYDITHVVPRHELYIHIALSKLSPETGMYTIFKGSHKRKQSVEERRKEKKGRLEKDDAYDDERDGVGVVLEPGDALIWQGGLRYRWSEGGGGT